MADPFVAEVRIFPFNFAPKGWAFCDGQILPLSQNTALFSLLGTMYGGNGQSTFALPDFQGSAVIDVGQGPGLSEYFQGVVGGSDALTLLVSEMPAHAHSVMALNSDFGTLNAPSPLRCLARSGSATAYQSNSNTGITQMSPNAISPAGGDQPHNNLMPYLTLNFNIALQGVFPPRT